MRHLFDPSFTYQADSVFTVNHLPSGTFYFVIISACGDTSRVGQVFVPGILPRIDSVTYLNSTCLIKDVAVHAAGSYGPYTYGYYRNDSFRYVFQSSDTLRDIPAYVTQIRVKDRCGDEAGFFLRSPCSLLTTPGDYESKNYLPGCQAFSGTDWIDVKDNYGNLVYSINPNNNTMNPVCWGVHVEPITGRLRTDQFNGAVSYFLGRNFYIEPPANITLSDSVSMRIYFTDAEMQSMPAIIYDSTGILYAPQDLKILKKKGSSSSPVDLSVINDANTMQTQFTVIYPLVQQYGNNWYMEFKVKDFSEFNPYIGEFTVLPLRFISFSAKRQNNKIALNWSTGNEVNTKSFEVLWSANGNDFSKVGEVPAKGSALIYNYEFSHYTPAAGNNYYRLNQVDKDGKYSMSKTISVSFSREGVIKLAPNPVHDKLTLQLPPGNEFKTLKIFDAMGRVVMKTNLFNSPVQSLDVHALSNGWYMLYLEGSTRQRISFTKQ